MSLGNWDVAIHYDGDSVNIRYATVLALSKEHAVLEALRTNRHKGICGTGVLVYATPFLKQVSG